MNPTHRAIRAKLQSMAPQRAVSFIAGLELPEDEAFCIIECDVRGKSRQQVAEKTVTVKVRQLSRGMEGNDVKTLQAALIANGFSCGSAGTDGDFGAGTEAALKKFQTKYSLGADSIAGNGTWGKLLGK